MHKTGRFKFGKLTEYPHLAPHDREIWERFIEANPDAYDSVDYDIRFGTGGFSEDEIANNVYVENIATLSKFRIDVVGFKKDGSMDCIEVRPRAGLSAFGSALGCCHFLEQETNDQKCTPTILTDKAQSDLEQLAGSYEVKLIEID